MKTKSKGERLKWTPLREAKPVLLNSTTLNSKKISPSIQPNLNNNNHFILVP